MPPHSPNPIDGNVKKNVLGASSAEIVLEVAPGVEVGAMITTASVENLGLQEGKEAYAVAKASKFMVAID
jgi:molybdopterin-binding protein